MKPQRDNFRRSIGGWAGICSFAFLASGCEADLQTRSPAAEARAGAWSEDTEAAWTEMKTRLDGQWRASVGEQKTIDVSYRVVSKGSTLVETFTSASGNETLSAYHRDGRALMATHYCAQGNQARLKAVKATRDSIVFRLLDATNVNGDQGVMQQLAFTFRADGFDQQSIYREPTDSSRRRRSASFGSSAGAASS